MKKESLLYLEPLLLFIKDILISFNERNANVIAFA